MSVSPNHTPASSRLPVDLEQWIRAELHQSVLHGATVLADAVRAKLGASVRAILFYGSCLRTKDDQHSLLDFYVFVDHYRGYTSATWAALNKMLPPNVYYIEVVAGDVTYRLKYAVVSLADLARLTSASTWQPYFWARFAQPCALVYSADAAAENQVVEACMRSLRTFVAAILPLLPQRFTVRELWQIGLRHTYRTELRSEPAGAAPQLYDFAPERYEAVTCAVLAEVPSVVAEHGDHTDSAFCKRDSSGQDQSAARWWNLRVVEGKTLFLLRILKNWCTFEGGVEYVMWKIERHSGVRADPGWKQKRIRILAVAVEAWKIYRKGGFR